MFLVQAGIYLFIGVMLSVMFYLLTRPEARGGYGVMPEPEENEEAASEGSPSEPTSEEGREQPHQPQGEPFINHLEAEAEAEVEA